jgi:hypothetical protein
LDERTEAAKIQINWSGSGAAPFSFDQWAVRHAGKLVYRLNSAKNELGRGRSGKMLKNIGVMRIRSRKMEIGIAGA